MSDEVADGKVFVAPRDRLPSEEDDSQRLIDAFSEATRRDCDVMIFPGDYKIGRLVIFAKKGRP